MSSNTTVDGDGVKMVLVICGIGSDDVDGIGICMDEIVVWE